MSDEVLKDLNRVIEKYKDKVFCTGELNYVDMAKSCELEIERLNNVIKRLEEDLREMYLTFGEFSEEYTEKTIKELKGSDK